MKNVSFVITFCFLGLFVINTYATTGHVTIDNALTPSVLADLQQGQTANVFVHISAVKNTPNGLTAQIDGFSAPKGNGGQNMLKARLEIQDNRLLIQLHPDNPKVAQLTMPAGYQLPKGLSDQLGASNPVVMSGGSTMVQQEAKSMLWFEIQ